MINLDQNQKKVRIKKIDIYECAFALYEGRELTLNTSKSGIFPLKPLALFQKYYSIS